MADERVYFSEGGWTVTASRVIFGRANIPVADVSVSKDTDTTFEMEGRQVISATIVVLGLLGAPAVAIWLRSWWPLWLILLVAWVLWIASIYSSWLTRWRITVHCRGERYETTTFFESRADRFIAAIVHSQADHRESKTSSVRSTPATSSSTGITLGPLVSTAKPATPPSLADPLANQLAAYFATLKESQDKVAEALALLEEAAETAWSAYYALPETAQASIHTPGTLIEFDADYIADIFHR